MNNYNKKYKRKIYITCAELLGIWLLFIGIRLSGVQLNEDVYDVQNGFMFGFSITLVFFILSLVIKARNKTKVKEYIIENEDERATLIAKSAGFYTTNIMIVLMTVAWLITSCINFNIATVLMVCLCTNIFLYGVIKLVLKRVY